MLIGAVANDIGERLEQTNAEANFAMSLVCDASGLTRRGGAGTRERWVVEASPMPRRVISDFFAGALRENYFE